MSDELLQTHHVARRLEVTPARVRQLVREGKLRAVVEVLGGLRLFSVAEVERVAAERAARRGRQQ